MRLNFFAISLAVTLCGPALAAEPESAAAEVHYSAGFTACRSAALATADVVFCIMTEAKVQEAKLDSALAQALKRLPAKRRAALRTAQAEWHRRAAAECDESVKDRTFERMAEAERGQCLLDSMIRRTAEIEKKR